LLGDYCGGGNWKLPRYILGIETQDGEEIEFAK
jgi:hypothetical protein